MEPTRSTLYDFYSALKYVPLQRICEKAVAVTCGNHVRDMSERLETQYIHTLKRVRDTREPMLRNHLNILTNSRDYLGESSSLGLREYMSHGKGYANHAIDVLESLYAVAQEFNLKPQDFVPTPRPERRHVA